MTTKRESCFAEAVRSASAPESSADVGHYAYDAAGNMVRKTVHGRTTTFAFNGGNPVASSKGTTYFNDVLGTAVGSKKGRKYTAAVLTAFGAPVPGAGSPAPSTKHSAPGTAPGTFFTGKPHVKASATPSSSATTAPPSPSGRPPIRSATPTAGTSWHIAGIMLRIASTYGEEWRMTPRA